jgi:asparagine synthase (glutamine-hydrolysing)
MDVSGSVDLYANRLAKNIAPVRLTGNYGQEILRNSISFKPRFLDEKLFDDEFVKLLKIAQQTYFSELNTRTLSFVAFKQVPWYHFARLAIESSQVRVSSPYLDNEIVALAFKAPTSANISKDLSLRLVAEGNPELKNIATDRGLVCYPIWMLTRINQVYYKLAFKAEYAYDYGMPRWLSLVNRYIQYVHPEKLFLGRHKFYHFRIWYRDKLSKFIKELLLDSRALQRPYINKHRLEEIVKQHTEGFANHTIELHCILTSELIYRSLIDYYN